MLRESAKVGQKVFFGRRNGQKTLGKIIKLNAINAIVETLEPRGRTNQQPPGEKWNVKYFGLTLAPDNTEPENTATTRPFSEDGEPLVFSLFAPREDTAILEAILSIYSSLSPENLTGDGEIPPARARARASELQRKLKHLEAALGRTVSETQAYGWLGSKNKFFADRFDRNNKQTA